MSFEGLRKLQRIVMMMMIIALPLHAIPKRFAIPSIGGDLASYFMLLGVALLVYEYFKYGFKIERNVKIFFVAYMGWQMICLAHGLYTYEYNELLTLDQIPKLQFLLGKLVGFGMVLPELLAIKVWLFIRFCKNILLLNNDVFVVAYYVYHVYYGAFEQCVKDLQKAAVILVCIMGVYSVVELAWLKTGAVWAENWLKAVNPWLYDPFNSHGWWPPLLWKNQLRSICHEPSFFGIISVFVMPFLWSIFIKAEKLRQLCFAFLILFLSIMISATNARTAIIVIGGELFLLCVSCGVMLMYSGRGEWLQYVKKATVIVYLVVCGFGINIYGLSALKSIPSTAVVNVAEEYLERNVSSVTDVNARSNTARYSNLVANLNVIAQYPFMGVGIGLSDAYIDDNIPEFGKSNGEIRLWGKYMHEKGVLKSGYPALNKYADIAIKNGLIGLCLYLLLPEFIAYKLLVYRKEVGISSNCFNAVISMLALLAVQVSNTAFVVCNGFVWGAMAVWIETMNEERKECGFYDAKNN